MALDRRRFLVASSACAFTIPFSQLLRADSQRAASYDYIIIGAGSAGCIIAAGLAAARPEAQILLLEAGRAVSDTEPMVWDPSLYMLSLIATLPHLEWGYRSEPQAALGGRSIDLIRGKGVGGCALRNGMVYVRGGEDGFNAWDVEGWNFERLLPHFSAVERQMGLTTAATDPLIEAIIAGSEAAGLNFAPDYNAQRNPLGISPLRYTIRGGRRETTHTEFLAQKHLPNLTILPETTVHRIVTEAGVAKSLICSGPNQEVFSLAAQSEIILSAGAIGSPHLLLLSGIGDQKELEAFDLPRTLHLPGVGQNFQDDIIINHLYMSDQPLPPTPYGIMGIVGFARSSLERLGQTDIQIHFAGGFDQERRFLMLSPMILLAESRGSIGLQSADPLTPPRIDPRFLQVESDWQRLIEGCRLVQKIASHPDLKSWCAQPISPAPGEMSEAAWKSFIQEQASTGLHYAGTCKMGRDPLAVVDAELRVHGIERLRVADASVIPRTVSGNTAGATMMIAHRAAALILGEESIL